MNPVDKMCITILSEDETIGVTNLTLDDLLILLQPDEQSKAEAREWIKNNPIVK